MNRPFGQSEQVLLDFLRANITLSSFEREDFIIQQTEIFMTLPPSVLENILDILYGASELMY